MTPFDFYSFFILFGIASIALHEWSHVTKMQRYGRDPDIYLKDWKICVGTPKDYKGLTHKQIKQVYLAGIIGGLIPIPIGVLLFSPWYALLTPLYLLWCWKDIKNAWRYR